MKAKKLATLLICSFSLLCQTACLTLNVNVNFPGSAVQQATDNYVHDLYLQKEKGKPAKSEAPPETATPPRSSFHFSLVKSVWAAETAVPAFHIDGPKANRIKEKLAGYLPEVLTQKR